MAIAVSVQIWNCKEAIDFSTISHSDLEIHFLSQRLHEEITFYIKSK